MRRFLAFIARVEATPLAIAIVDLVYIDGFEEPTEDLGLVSCRVRTPN